MKNILAIVGALALIFAALGYYRSWYTFNSTETTIDLSIDKAKIVSDEEEFQRQAREKVRSWRGEPGTAEGEQPPGQLDPAIPPGTPARK